MKWLKAIRAAGKEFHTHAHYKAAVEDLKLVTCNVHSVDEVFSKIQYTRLGNELAVNGATWRTIQNHLRVGEIRYALKKMKIPSAVTLKDEIALKNILRTQVPEFEAIELKKNIEAAKVMHSDLHVTADTGAELEAKLDVKSKAKLTATWNKLKNVVGVGGKAAGIIGAIVVGGNMYENLVTATKERNGCFILQKVNGKTKACKILNRSCGSKDEKNACDSKTARLLHQNISILIKNALAHDKSSLEFANFTLGFPLTSANVDKVLSDTNNVNKLITTYAAYGAEEAAYPCQVAGKSTGCVACDPSAQRTSVEYVDDSELPINFSVQCITDSSILDTLVDATTGVGMKLWSRVEDSFGSGGTMKIVAIVVTLFMVVLIVISLYLKLKPNKSNATTLEISSAPPLAADTSKSNYRPAAAASTQLKANDYYYYNVPR